MVEKGPTVSHTGLKLSVQPNPASEEVCINAQGFTERALGEIFNLRGQKILTMHFAHPGMFIAAKELSNGIYFIRFSIHSRNMLITRFLVVR